MERHSENLTGVQKELWRLITDEDIRTILEAIIEKMNNAGHDSEHIRQWRAEGQSYIPADPKYDAKYWVAAYILHANLEKFKELFDKLDKINSELSSLKNELDELEDEQEHLRDIIQDLRDAMKSLLEEDEDDEDEEEDEEVANLLYDINQYKEELEDAKETYKETLDRLYELENEKKELLRGIIEITEQLVAS